MIYPRRFFLFTLCILTISPAWGGDVGAWSFAKEVDGITLYTRTVQDSPVKAVKAVMVVDGSPGVAAALIMDPASSPEWIFGVESTEVVKSEGPDEIWVRALIDLPWPLSDRDNVNQMKLLRSADNGGIVIEMINRPKARAIEEGVIRMPVAEGRWLLKPSDPSHVEITQEYMVDPGGEVPDWVLDLFTLKGPIATFKQMRHMMQKPEYRNASLAYSDK